MFATINCKQNLWIAILLGHVILTVFKRIYLSLISILLCIASHITMCSAFMYTYVHSLPPTKFIQWESFSAIHSLGVVKTLLSDEVIEVEKVNHKNIG